jgi:hypothetical protein
MMWTLIIIGLAFVIWRFMQPQGDQAAAASAAPPPPPPPPPSSAPSGGEDPFTSSMPAQEGESPAPPSGEVDPFKAPGS